MKILHSKHLTLRPYRPQDRERFIALVVNPQVIRFLSNYVQSEAEAGRWFDQIQAYYQRTPEPLENSWSVTLRGNPQAIIGHCALRPSGFTMVRERELEFLFDPTQWGKGYGSELASLVIAYGLEDLGLDAIIATVHPDNQAAIRIIEKSGMEQIKQDQLENGQPVLVYSARRI
jgi:RimJ/RimL family protein N-acetyltransferase